MASTISNVYIQTFETNLRYLAQQAETKLRGTVMERSTNGEKHNWERLGTIEAQDKIGRLVNTPVQDTPWSRRVSITQPFHVGDSTELEDPTQMLIDPNSSITRELAYAMRRKMDDIIIAAATGDALDGQNNPVPLPAGQIVGDGTTEISFGMITQVQEKFMRNEIDPSVPKVAVVGPAQVRKLMQLTEQTSADYVNREALQRLTASGIVPNWMGFTWIMSNRLLSPAVGQLDCLFYTERAIGLQVNQDIAAKVAPDPSKSFAWRLYAHANMGAVRVEDEQIVVARVAGV